MNWRERSEAWRAAWSARVPPCENDGWRVDRAEKPADATLTFADIRQEAMGRGVPPGAYTRLLRRNRWTDYRGEERTSESLVMSDTPAEYRDHLPLFWEVSRREARRVLVHGLGLGCALGVLLSMDHTEHVDVVEISGDLVDLVGPYFDDPRVHVHVGDALTYRFPRGTRWDVAWHDIWDNISRDNQQDMTLLSRRYGGRVGWQDCWARELIR